MEELFGVSMDSIMRVLLAIFLVAMAVVAVLAWQNRIMLKMGLRNIPRRPGQTVLIIVGVMLSTLIISAAFGTGDTVSFSIRKDVLVALGPIDEIIVSDRAGAGDSFGTRFYFPIQRFRQLQVELAGLDSIDGLTPQVAETAPALNLRTSLSEGHMRVAGIDPELLQGFGAFTLTSGQEVRLEELAEGEAYINDEAAEELEAVAGDELRVFIGDDPLTFTVKGIVERGGLAGSDSTLIIPLDHAQKIFDRAGQINLMVVSNRGGVRSGVRQSEDVTQRLRVIFTDRSVASQLHQVLKQPEVLRALEERRETLDGRIREELGQLTRELGRQELSDELISLLADKDVSDEVLDMLDLDELRDIQPEVDTLFIELGEFRVLDVKRELLDLADNVGSFITTFFLIMGLFSIMVGVLLLFLIFVMLAAARRSEMGMARAIGAKRRHLVQMFLFEGTAYALVSAAVGVALGLAVSVLMVWVLNRIFSTFDDAFRVASHFELRTVIVSYCLGMVITFATIAVSSYRVSRLNIVSAIRDLPTPVIVSTREWREILIAPWHALQLPIRLLWISLYALATLHPLRALTYLLRTPWAILSVPAVATGSIFQVVWRPFTQGWLAFLMGLLLAVQGAGVWEQTAPFTIGVSLMIIGAGLSVRTVLQHTSMRADVRDRIAYTFIGVVMLVFWTMPFNTLEPITGELDADFEMFFISGVLMVAAAVWTVMYNADLLVKALSFLTGRVGKLRPVMVTAVAYPMSDKFRTGLTLAMFALVIFTLMVMSILPEVFSRSTASNVEEITGRWDIEGNLNFTTPIVDIRQAVEEAPGLGILDFEAIGGYTRIPIDARQVGAEDQRWNEGAQAVRAADDAFLDANEYKLKLIAEGYGPTGREVWQALKNNPGLAVVEGWLVPNSPDHEQDWPPFLLEGVYYDDDEMSPVDIEVRDRITNTVIPLKVIGVLDRIANSDGDCCDGMFISKATVDAVVPFAVPITTYRFRLAQGVDVAPVARDIEAAFVEHGMETEVLEEVLEEEAAAGQAFFRLFTGFMGLGLLVGIAGLGVISTRAVVERRQQIGVLRAIGYRRSMIQLSFLLESSFVALLGTAIGVVLGFILSYNLINEFREEAGIDTIRFVVPWLQIIVIIVLTYLFSLLATYLPARQASRIYPAAALRYE